MEVLRSCEESGPGPVLADSSAELGGRLDMAVVRPSWCRSLFRARVEATSHALSAAILVERRHGADVSHLAVGSTAASSVRLQE